MNALWYSYVYLLAQRQSYYLLSFYSCLRIFLLAQLPEFSSQDTYIEYKTVGYSSEVVLVENQRYNQSGHVRHVAGIVVRRRLTSIVSANYRLATGSANENADAIVPLF